MAKVQTKEEVKIDDVRRKLSEALGPRYRVTVTSDSKLKVAYPGVIPSSVTVSHTIGGTTFNVQTTGLIVSRLVQAASINPKIKRALGEAYQN